MSFQPQQRSNLSHNVLVVNCVDANFCLCDVINGFWFSGCRAHSFPFVGRPKQCGQIRLFNAAMRRATLWKCQYFWDGCDLLLGSMSGRSAKGEGTC